MSNLTNYKYLYISSIDVSIGNGPGVNEREFIVSLSKLLGDKVKFLLPKPTNKLDESFPIDQCVFSINFNRDKKFKFIFHTLSQIYKGLRIKSKYDTNMIIFRLNKLPISQMVLAKIFNKPYHIKTIGPGLVQSNSKKGNINYLLEKTSNYMNKKLIINAKSLDAVSDKHISDTETIINKELNIIKIDNGVNTNRFMILNKKKVKNEKLANNWKFVIGYAGNYPMNRGASQIISIASKLIEEYKDIGFVILGEDENPSILAEEIAKNNLKDYFLTPGRVPYSEVPLWINTFDIGISFLEPKHMGASEQKIRQYIGCGIPVVCSSKSSQFIEENNLGIITSWDNHDEIFNAISNILKNRLYESNEERNRISTYAEKYLSIDARNTERIDFWIKNLGE